MGALLDMIFDKDGQDRELCRLKNENEWLQDDLNVRQRTIQSLRASNNELRHELRLLRTELASANTHLSDHQLTVIQLREALYELLAIIDASRLINQVATAVPERIRKIVETPPALPEDHPLVLKGRINDLLHVIRGLLVSETVLGDFDQDIVDQAQKVVDNAHFGVF
jgi:hypothetical protein